MSIRAATIDPSRPGGARIVISRGADRGPLAASDGGTEDLQLLTYDVALARWNVTFDAHTVSVYPGFSIDDYDTHEAHAVLPAADPITDVSGSTIELEPGHLQLLLSAVDSATEDASIERVACIGVIDGVARLDYYSAVPDDSVPHLSGAAQHRQFGLSAPYVSPVDAAAYPVRDYTQTIGYLGGRVRVIADDRAGIGVTVAVHDQSDGTGTLPIAVAVQPGSPAAHAGIRPGDGLESILPAIRRSEDSGNEQPAIVDELAAHRVGDHLTVSLVREDQEVTAHLTPVMIEDTVAAPGHETPTPATIGIGVDEYGQTLGADIASVVPNSPAALGGLVIGDTITEVGDVPVVDAQTLQDALLGTADRLVEVTVTAPNGATETLRVQPDPANPNDATQPTAYLLYRSFTRKLAASHVDPAFGEPRAGQLACWRSSLSGHRRGGRAGIRGRLPRSGEERPRQGTSRPGSSR